MNQVEQRQAAKRFVERWQAEEGNEDRQSRSFWIEFAQDLMGVPNPTHVLDFERKVKGRKIDVFYEDMGVLIEQKSRGVDLDKKSERSKRAGEETPYQQAKWYADNLPYSVRPRWIIVSNFDELRIHDLDVEDPEHDFTTVTLEELPEYLHLFDFLTDKSASRLVKEQELSVKAGEIVGRLYKSLAAQYKNIDIDADEQRSLNILIVRFVFLLYAEDAGLLQEHQAFLNYMRDIAPENFRDALRQLFEVLDTPEDARDPYLSEKLAAFPYINGSLFSRENIIIPQFTQQIKYDLLKEASQDFDWSGISPTIFGAAFESTLNPETRRAGGMHYTSIENIHKVIDPLFLDDLKAELADIEGIKVEKTRNLKLRQFQAKLASIKILDPACGSGNFLTESYLSLRKLENRVLENLMGEQMGLGFTGEANPIKVSIDQFYGIEINDFAVAVAKTALWIAEEQMMDVTQEIMLTPLQFLPLTSNNNIIQANALRMDWNDLLPAEECDYIIGNPPFVANTSRKAVDKGSSFPSMTPEQKADREYIWGQNCGLLDYVSCWFKKAADFILNFDIHCAFVATNSITQGQQVEPIWKPLFDTGITIDFAYESFQWSSEADGQATVFVVIIGFSRRGVSQRRLFAQVGFEEADYISPDLKPNRKVVVSKRSNPLSKIKPLKSGGKPVEGGHLIFKNEEELTKFLKEEPAARKYVRPFSMGEDFIKGQQRFCLWMPEIDAAELDMLPKVRERTDQVKEFRLSSSKKTTRDKAATPWRFDEVREPDGVYIGIPIVTSSRRTYVPIGFVTDGMIPGNKLYFIESDSLYYFGILSSHMHNLWIRETAGRYGPSYNYSNTMVYNNFIWPDPTEEQKQVIKQAAQAVLDARDAHPGKSLADLYDPDKMPADLLAAHKALDKAVEEAYGVNFNSNEEKIVAHLFKLYAEAAGEDE